MKDKQLPPGTYGVKITDVLPAITSSGLSFQVLAMDVKSGAQLKFMQRPNALERGLKNER